MASAPHRWEKKWRTPVRTRHVLVYGIGRPTALPMQGLILEWKRKDKGRTWIAHVAYIDDRYPDSKLIVQWLEAKSLRPVPWIDPNL